MQPLKSSKLALIEAIKTSSETTLAELAQVTGLGKTTVRQHLQDLENSGLVLPDFRKTRRGRPELIYKLTAATQRSFPSQDGKVLQDLIAYAESSGHQELLQDFFGNFWALKKEEFQARLKAHGSQDFKARLSVLRSLLKEEGFMPKIEREAKGHATVHECNCPFSQTVKATQLPCQLELDFIRFALKTAVTRTKYIPAGETTCSYRTS